jgi:hypothetical protein
MRGKVGGGRLGERVKVGVGVGGRNVPSVVCIYE